MTDERPIEEGGEQEREEPAVGTPDPSSPDADQSPEGTDGGQDEHADTAAREGEPAGTPRATVGFHREVANEANRPWSARSWLHHDAGHHARARRGRRRSLHERVRAGATPPPAWVLTAVGTDGHPALGAVRRIREDDR